MLYEVIFKVAVYVPCGVPYGRCELRSSTVGCILNRLMNSHFQPTTHVPRFYLGTCVCMFVFIFYFTCYEVITIWEFYESYYRKGL